MANCETWLPGFEDRLVSYVVGPVTYVAVSWPRTSDLAGKYSGRKYRLNDYVTLPLNGATTQ